MANVETAMATEQLSKTNENANPKRNNE